MKFIITDAGCQCFPVDSPIRKLPECIKNRLLEFFLLLLLRVLRAD